MITPASFPADGLYGREMNTALIQVLQTLEGFTPDEATSNFGSGTRSRLKVITPDNAPQYADWVWLATVALVCNGQLSTFYGEWNPTVSEAVMTFQRDYALPVNQSVDVYMWMSLLTSCDNPNRPTVTCDTRFETTDEFAEQPLVPAGRVEWCFIRSMSPAAPILCSHWSSRAPWSLSCSYRS